MRNSLVSRPIILYSARIVIGLLISTMFCWHFSYHGKQTMEKKANSAPASGFSSAKKCTL